MKPRYLLIPCLLLLIANGCAKGSRPEKSSDLCLMLTPSNVQLEDVDVISDELAEWLDIYDSLYEQACRPSGHANRMIGPNGPTPPGPRTP